MTIKTILIDIEGTTTSIDFVHKTLFPFAAHHLPSFIQQHHTEKKIHDILQETKEEALLPSNSSLKEVTETLLQWINEDRKSTPLKKIQGLIWHEGYKSGELKSHIYPDVVDNLNNWQQEGYTLAIYSSGSIEAQKTLFAHTTSGNISSCFSAHFDTTSGHKRDIKSYQEIAQNLKSQTDQILFLSDVAEELDAAQKAGYQTIQLVRENDQTVANNTGHKIAADFSEVSGYLKEKS